MKRTTSTLALAAPLAIVALSLGATPAMAEPSGPAIDQVKSTELGPVNPHLPEGPQDETLPTDEPDPEPEPDGPKGPDDKITNPQPCPTHGDCGKDPGDEDEKDPHEKDPGDGDDFKKPNRIDAGAGSSDGGMELAWLIAGGGLITATGAAYADRRRSSMSA